MRVVPFEYFQERRAQLRLRELGARALEPTLKLTPREIAHRRAMLANMAKKEMLEVFRPGNS